MTDKTITITLSVNHAEKLLSALNSGAVALNDKAGNPDESCGENELMREHWTTFYRGRYRELTDFWSIVASLMPDADPDELPEGEVCHE